MAKFKRKGKGGTPAISTASLPDIVFMLLFFFMVTTTMREVTLLVKNTKPYATEIQKLERKSLVNYIYVGAPKDYLAGQFGTEPRLQLDDSFAQVNEITQWVEIVREEVNEAERPLMTISIKADKKTKMGLISDIKQELRKANALKINYSTTPGEIFGGEDR
jgi:biopolymer transport protein ExbD